MTGSHQTAAFRARYVFPVGGPPIPGGVVTIAQDRIVNVGAAAGIPPLDLGNTAILPGLVNAHTHLEFSDLPAPLGQTGMRLPDWIRLVMDHRCRRSGPVAAAVRKGIDESLACGTTCLGEIATDPGSGRAFAGASVHATVFFEVLGLSPERTAASLAAAESWLASDASQLTRCGLSPHAPYSTHLDLVAGTVKLAVRRALPVAMHLAESAEELDLLATGQGPFAELLAELGAWRADAFRPGAETLDYLSLLDRAPRALVVHGNYLNQKDRRFIAQQAGRMTVVYCPRTHARFGHPPYPLPELLAEGVGVALGTDGRASNPDLSLLAEMRHVARAFGNLWGSCVLELGTLRSAQALGRDHDIGSLRPGKRADLCIVELPEGNRADPHDLLFEEDLPAAATVFGGVVVAGHDRIERNA